MRNLNLIIFASMTLFGLSGCGSSSSGAGASAEPSSANKIFTADPGGDPENILDATLLGADIDGIFGGENAEPVSVSPGDTIGDVFDRAKSS